jgi:hypothetical protein
MLSRNRAVRGLQDNDGYLAVVQFAVRGPVRKWEAIVMIFSTAMK